MESKKMQFVVGNGNYVSMRSNIIFATGRDVPPKILPIIEEDCRESISYNNVKQTLKNFVRFDPNYGFGFQSLLLVGPPMCGKSSLLLRICSQNPKISVFVLQPEELVATDVSLFISMARASNGSIIIIEDLDQVLSFEGRVYSLKRQLLQKLRRLYSENEGIQGTMLVIAESRYPWTLHSETIDKYFPNQLCIQQPTKQAMLAQDRKLFDFPPEWVDEIYLRNLQSYKNEQVKPFTFRIHARPHNAKLSWLLNLFSRIRRW